MPTKSTTKLERAHQQLDALVAHIEDIGEPSLVCLEGRCPPARALVSILDEIREESRND